MITTFRDDEYNIDIVIAPRQSGKTIMLVDNAIQYIIENNSNVYIVCMNNRVVDHIKTIVDEVVRELPYRSDILRKIYYDGSHHLDYLSSVEHNTRVYFDESDLINNIPLIKNAYYTTTPSTGITNRFIDILESGEYNEFGRRLASIESTEPEVVNVDMERVVIPQPDDSFTIGNVDDETLYLYRIGVD
jgi:hypothetical protein